MQVDLGLICVCRNWYLSLGSLSLCWLRFQITSSRIFSKWPREGSSWSFPCRDWSPGSRVSIPGPATIVVDFFSDVTHLCKSILEPSLISLGLRQCPTPITKAEPTVHEICKLGCRGECISEQNLGLEAGKKLENISTAPMPLTGGKTAGAAFRCPYHKYP